MRLKTALYAGGMLITGAVALSLHSASAPLQLSSPAAGSINTIATKYQVCRQLYILIQHATAHTSSCAQDITVVGHDAAGKQVTFQHPAFQSAFMFLGEALCLIPFALVVWRKSALGTSKSRFLKQSGQTRLRAALFFAIPAVCDSGATTLLNVRPDLSAG